MGQRVVQVTTELVTMFWTKGFRAGGDDTVLETVAGLPEGAKLEHSFLRWYDEGVGVLCLVYSHPDFEGPAEGENIPDLEVRFERRQVERISQCNG